MNLTKLETELLSYLEGDFIDEIEECNSTEILLTMKGYPSRKIGEVFQKFIDKIYQMKATMPIVEVKQNYRSELTRFKQALNQAENNSQINQIPILQSQSIVNSDFAPQDLSNTMLLEDGIGFSNTILLEDDLVCIIEIRHVQKNELELLLNKFINTFTGILIIIPYETKEYSLVEDIIVHDELGEWTYDHFQSCIRVYFKRLKGIFPKKFRIPENFFSKKPNLIRYQEYQEHELVEKQQNANLKQFLNTVIKSNQKDPHYITTWMNKLREQHVDRLDELLAWDDKDWDNAKIEVNTRKLIQRQLNKFKYKSNKKHKTSFSTSEKYSITHKIKRFLTWKTNPKEIKELDNVELLDPRAVEQGFKEIREEYTGEYLLSQLSTFYESYSIARSYSKNLILNRGMLLFGPPGTGKTTLAETLPNKIGLAAISDPLCAAEVNRSLVGQTEKLLMDLVSRANHLPYLLCCVAIDEIDGLAPKRDEKSSQHKVDALAVLLSVIGGIKDVPNLIFLASTNRLNQMDDAFKRRMSGQFFVGRPSPAARRIIIKGSQKTGLDEQMIEQVVMMTSNFSGAALKQFISYMITELKKNRHQQKNPDYTLSFEQLADLAATTSKQFNIKLGNHSLPELFSLQNQKEKLLSLPFLKSLKQNQAIVIFKQDYMLIEYKRNVIISTDSQKTKEAQVLDTRYIMSKAKCQSFKDLKFNLNLHTLRENWIENDKYSDNHSDKKSLIKVDFVSMHEIINLQNLQIIEQKIQEFEEEARKYPNSTFVMLWDDMFDYNSESIKNTDYLMKWTLRYFESKSEIGNLFYLFTTSENNYPLLKRETSWYTVKPFDKKKLKYTGKILVDLNDDEPEMRFELDEDDDKYQLHCESLLLEKRANNSAKVLPRLIEFASERGIDFILLMDQDFLLSNNAFDESKIKESITEKMQEFSFYEKSLLIIDVDSIVGIVRSVSHSSMGPSTSYNISDTKLYGMIIHYANSLPKILNNSEYWVALISKNEELTASIKKDLNWPKTLKELKKDEEDEKLEREVVCIRCGEIYKENDNKINSCNFHPGMLFGVSAPWFEWTLLTPEEAKIISMKKSMKNKQEPGNKSNETIFWHICCLKPEESPCCKKYKHTSNEKQYGQEVKNSWNEYQKKLIELKRVANGQEGIEMCD